MATQQEQQLTALEIEYRRAWRRFMSEAESLRQVMGDPASEAEAVRVARTRADQAVLEYREARDRLATLLLETDEEMRALAASQAA